MQLSKHFELSEFVVSETAARKNIDNDPTPEAIQNLHWLCQAVLEPLRTALGRPVVITSGYRSAALNRAVGGSKTSHHMQGRAADITVPGLTPLAVCLTAQHLRLPCEQIIHEFGRWAHLAVSLPGTPVQSLTTQVLTATMVGEKIQYREGLHNV
jgi:hypothetical protein